MQHGVVVLSGDFLGFGDIGELDEIVIQPLTVGLFGSDPALDFLIRDDPAFLHVHDEHAAWLQAAFDSDALGFDGEHAGFGGHDHQIVLGHIITRRTQAIPVEGGADHGPVREGHRGGAVPWFHEAGVIFVECLLFVAHRLMAAPRLRNHHHHGVGQRAAPHHQQFEDVVEHGGVRAVGIDDGQDFFDVLAKQGALQQGLAGIHPVHVAAQGVDFTVVRDVAVRVGTLPTGEGIGRETGVDQREGRVHIRVLEVDEILADLLRHQHSFINHGAAGHAGRVPEGIQTGGPDLIVAALADDVEFALERLIVRAIGPALDKHLTHERFAGLGGIAEGGVVGRHIPPPQDGLTFLLGDLFKFALAGLTLGRHRRRVNHPHAILTGCRQRDFGHGRHFPEKSIRHLHQNASPVSSIGLAATGSAMVQIDQNRQGLLNDGMGTFPLHLAYESDATGVVFKLWIVQALLLGESVFAHVFSEFWWGGDQKGASR